MEVTKLSTCDCFMEKLSLTGLYDRRVGKGVPSGPIVGMIMEMEKKSQNLAVS
jgi:hypothetical protein